MNDKWEMNREPRQLLVADARNLQSPELSAAASGAHHLAC